MKSYSLWKLLQTMWKMKRLVFMGSDVWLLDMNGILIQGKAWSISKLNWPFWVECVQHRSWRKIFFCHRCQVYKLVQLVTQILPIFIKEFLFIFIETQASVSFPSFYCCCMLALFLSTLNLLLLVWIHYLFIVFLIYALLNDIVNSLW